MMKLKSFTKIAGSITALTGVFAVSSAQGQVTFSGTGTGADGNAVAASATFNIVSGQLVVTLVNTESASTFGIGDTLYGLFFDGATGLSLVSTVAPQGDTFWDVKDGTSSAVTSPSGQSISTWQIASFNSQNGVSALVGGNQENGLVSAGFELADAGDGLVSNANHNPVIQDELIFTFNYTSLSSLGAITNVTFRYNTSGDTTVTGTPTNPPPPTPVPEISTIVAGALMVLPLGIGAIRALRKEQSPRI